VFVCSCGVSQETENIDTNIESNSEEVEAAFGTIAREGAEAVIVQGIFFSQTITELALKYRLPTASVLRQFAQAGGLISYGADIREIFRRSAGLVHKILQGTKPSELPVELPTRFELVLNMTTAKTLGIEVPLFFQQRADEVIE
jgi:putative ABC transport system substrate-binding protein